MENGQYLKTIGMKLYKISEYETTIENSISYNYNFGFSSYYKIGKDFSAGTYKITGDNYYYSICSKPSCDISLSNSEMVENHFNETENTTTEFTVENGQYLVVNGTKPFTITK